MSWSRSGAGPTPAPSGTSAGARRISTRRSPSAPPSSCATASWCRRARASWRTRYRRASSPSPRPRRRPCCGRWPSPEPPTDVYSAPVFKLLSTTGDQSIELQSGRALVVGRAVTSDVPIYDPTISRRHAEVALSDRGVKVKDLGSSNGTFLNGARVTEAEASSNDIVTFGKVAVKVIEVTAPQLPQVAASPA